MALLGQLRRDTLENWQLNNPVLADGEIALVASNPALPKKYTYWVVGDGTTDFNSLDLNNIVSLFSSLGITGITSELGDRIDLAISQKLLTSINTKLENLINTLKDKDIIDE